MNKDFDLAIAGSGFAGSLLAMIARRLGLSVVLFERSRHPRFVVGESTTPLTNLLLEELATRYDLPRLLPLSKWGTWQTAYPAIACGLKRGFTFYHHVFNAHFRAAPDRSDQLLVAASPHDLIADTHWYRPDFDHFLVREAQACGVEYLDEAVLQAPEPRGDRVVLTGVSRQVPFHISCRFLVDATGPGGFLRRALKLPRSPFPHMPRTQGLYTHFRGVRRLESQDAYCNEVLPLESQDLGASPQRPPYPPDDAAVHHVFDGGWIWVLRFNNGITSAGVAAVDSVAAELRFADGAPAWERLMHRLPTVAEQFAEAQPVFPFVHAPRLPFMTATIAGDWFALLPSAAGFVDPLLSTGFPMTLLGVARLAEAIADAWDSPAFKQRLRPYATETARDLAAAQRLVAALYANMSDFRMFTAVTMLYFAAVSFTEAARRLRKPELGSSFLLRDDPGFGAISRSCLQAAMGAPSGSARTDLMARILAAIEPFDVAGLSASDRRNWHPVLAEDLLEAAPKLGVNRGNIEALLTRTGFYQGTAPM